LPDKLSGTFERVSPPPLSAQRGPAKQPFGAQQALAVDLGQAKRSARGIGDIHLAGWDRFVKKHGLNFPLLSDPDHGLLQAYGVWVEKSLYGRKYFGIHRSSFVVGADGRIEKTWDKVKPDTHAAEVLAWLSEHAPAGAKAARRR